MLLALLVLAAPRPCAPCLQLTMFMTLRQGIPTAHAIPMNDATILGLRATVDEEEIESAQWAVKHASSPTVRDFARSLLRGHGNAQNSAKGIADRLKVRINIPGDTDSALVSRHNVEMASLRTAKGRQFDRVFLQAVRDDHMNEIAKVTNWYLPAARNDSVRTYLHDIMPTLAKHQQIAEKLLAQPRTTVATKRGR